jgi:hypothetical protein
MSSACPCEHARIAPTFFSRTGPASGVCGILFRESFAARIAACSAHVLRVIASVPWSQQDIVVTLFRDGRRFQFGHFSGQLGDGATMYLGEVCLNHLRALGTAPLRCGSLRLRRRRGECR